MQAFGEKMLQGLRDATARIEGNWQCVDELGCYIAIARRILSLSNSDAIKRDALAYLTRAREVSLGFVRTRKERVDNAIDAKISEFRSKVACAALVCVDTFNFLDTFTNSQDVFDLVLPTTANAADFIECCITV